MAAVPGAAADAADNNKRDHVISALVDNRSGVLARISGMFSARAFNIDSLTVGETLDPDVSRLTLTARGDDGVIHQIINQLSKIVEVIRVVDLSEFDHVDRELVLLKIKVDAGRRGDVIEITELFRARIVDVSHEALTIEAVGAQGKINAMLEMFSPFGIVEIARSGRVAMFRGEETLKLPD